MKSDKKVMSVPRLPHARSESHLPKLEFFVTSVESKGVESEQA